MKYKLLTSSHSTRAGKKYTKGDEIESDTDLVAKFGAAKFERVHSAEDYKKQPADAPVTPPSDEYGNDVTELFAEAEKADLRVFKKGAKFNVFDADDLATPLNPKALKKSEVEPFVAKYYEAPASPGAEE